MDVLWSPWRHEYIKGACPDGDPGCVFCNIGADPARDRENFVLTRGRYNFVVLNIYPYAAGHLLIVPFEHLDLLDKADDHTTGEMMHLIKASQSALSETYSPEGFNIGMNLGRSAGAGIADHIHAHILPRWSGDVNFITSIGETRNIPETLTDTYARLSGKIVV
jgi:ATP adenylyltransferase